VSLGNTTYLYRVGMTLECEEAGERRKFQVDRDGTSLDEVAVGTIISDRPPHRSARALISACGSYLG
jgi:hypothetical protein